MKPRVMVAQPIYGWVPGEAAMSFATMLVNGSMNGLIHGVRQTTSPSIGRARNLLVQQALEADSTHIFFVDSDMILPAGALKHLYSLENQLRGQVVSGLYFARKAPYGPVHKLMPGSTPHPTRPFEVRAVGMGCALISTDVFRRLADDPEGDRWFDVTEDEGEDVAFCRRCHDASVGCFVDPTLKCGHVADVVITQEHYERHTKGDVSFV
jgi:hypothetical protein